MSYVDGSSGRGRKALTGGTVATIQVGLAIALVHGFAVVMVERDQPPPLTGTQIPLPPVPQPTPEQETAAPREVRTTSFTEASPQPLARSPVEVAPIPTFPPSTGIDLEDAIFIPPVGPSEAPARFSPKAAKPRNDVAGWVTTDDYPTAEIRAGHAGTVRFRLAIDADGRVTGCTIEQSSGYPRLDDATCRHASRRARFDPASDAMGERVAGSYAGTIRWVIPRD